LNDSFAGRFEVFVYGGRNTLFSWSQMAFVAPLESLEGGIDGILLENGIGKRDGRGSGSGLPVSNGAENKGGWLGVLDGIMAVFFL